MIPARPIERPPSDPVIRFWWGFFLRIADRARRTLEILEREEKEAAREASVAGRRPTDATPIRQDSPPQGRMRLDNIASSTLWPVDAYMKNTHVREANRRHRALNRARSR